MSNLPVRRTEDAELVGRTIVRTGSALDHRWFVFDDGSFYFVNAEAEEYGSEELNETFEIDPWMYEMMGLLSEEVTERLQLIVERIGWEDEIKGLQERLEFVQGELEALNAKEKTAEKAILPDVG